MKQMTKHELEQRIIPSDEFMTSKKLGFIMQIEAALGRMPEAIGIVLFENQQFDSSCFGQQQALVIGPGRTYESVEACEGKWLNDMPSQRQHPTCWVPRSEFFPEPSLMAGEEMMPIEDQTKYRFEDEEDDHGS